MKVMDILSGIRSGGSPSPGELLNALSEAFHLIHQLESTQQDPEWHAEGNVRILTKW